MANTLHSLSRSAANNKSDVLKGTPRDDVLHGGLGHTTFYGGLGDDIYYSKNAGDTIVEYANEGNDTVYADTTFTLPTHVENLTLEGNGNTFGFGNNSNNILIGNSGNNRLSGEEGNDFLYGMGGHDTLSGGNGNDHLNGGDGDDYLAGGLGSDTIITGAGRDTVAFTAADIREGSIDRLLDFNPETDKFDLSGMRSLLTGSNANLSWSKMFVDKDPEVILQKDHPYLIFDTEQQTLAYRAAGSSSSTVFAKFDSDDPSKWLDASNIIG